MMNIQHTEWNGFERLDFSFQGHDALLILPQEPRADKKWLFKTEYFGAFPAFELAMLQRGYHLAYVQNATRWATKEDTDLQAAFCRFLTDHFGLAQRCMPVGMSCGGAEAVCLAGLYPELIGAMYLDAPVLNYLSCPCAVSTGSRDEAVYEEFVRATGLTVQSLVNFREHPIDLVDRFLDKKIPVLLICGDKDTGVPFSENGSILEQKYKAAGAPIVTFLKKDCGHHPHGLDDLGPMIDFASKYYG